MTAPDISNVLDTPDGTDRDRWKPVLPFCVNIKVSNYSGEHIANSNSFALAGEGRRGVSSPSAPASTDFRPFHNEGDIE